MDALALVLDFQGFAVVALALADVTRHVDIRQEVHLYLNQTVALARLTTATFDVEREATRAITTGARFRHAGEQFTNRCEQTRVSRRVRARGTADWALVNVDHLIQMLQTVDAVVCRCFQRGRSVECGRAERE